jgi:hypothetical protein
MSRVQFLAGARKEFFLFVTPIQTNTGATHPPIQQVLEAFSLVIKQLGHESDHPPPSSTEVKHVWSYTPTYPYVFMPWCFLLY